jgi:myo-inositol-1(or 4)-monophosphatase
VIRPQELLAVALEAAHAAGEELISRLGSERDVERKGFRDVVTDADLAAESALLSVVRRHFPHHTTLSEEAGGRVGDSGYTWVIDPLDGTTNYSYAHPTFSVSIAALWRGEPTVGVVYDPVRGHVFAACRGAGATLNGRPVHVSGRGRLADALVALDWAHADADRREVLWRLVALAPHCRTVRSLGSAALALAYVGAGWLDVYFANALRPWDMAAAGLVVTEAGGEMSGLDGKPWQVEGRTVLATNGKLGRAVLALWDEAERSG